MLRILTAICAVAGLVLAFNVASAGAQDAGSAVTVSVRALGCADGAARRCEEPLAGVGYTAAEAGQDNGVGATTGADGAASLSLPVADGAETVSVVVVGATPAGYRSHSVSCADPETGAEVPVEPADGGVAFEAEPGDLVVCDWSYVPADGGDGGDADGSLTITKYACPAGFDAATDDVAACRETPLAGVHLTSFPAGTDNGVGATTDADGVARFPLLAADLPGDVSVFEDMPAGYAAFAVECADAAGNPVAVQEAGAATVTLLGVGDGARIACEWFNIPDGDGDDDDPEPTPTPAVGRLPHTGTGAGGGRAPVAEAVGLLLAGGCAAAGLVAVARRRLT